MKAYKNVEWYDENGLKEVLSPDENGYMWHKSIDQFKNKRELTFEDVLEYGIVKFLCQIDKDSIKGFIEDYSIFINFKMEDLNEIPASYRPTFVNIYQKNFTKDFYQKYSYKRFGIKELKSLDCSLFDENCEFLNVIKEKFILDLEQYYHEREKNLSQLNISEEELYQSKNNQIIEAIKTVEDKREEYTYQLNLEKRMALSEKMGAIYHDSTKENADRMEEVLRKYHHQGFSFGEAGREAKFRNGRDL